MHRDQPSVHARAKGRWPGILSRLGVDAKILNVRKHHPCPWCGGKDRFRFTDNEGTGSFYCGQCGQHSPVDFLMHVRGWDFATAAKEVESIVGSIPAHSPAPDRSERASADMRRLWKSTSPITKDDFVDRYLRSRGIDLTAFPPGLRKIDRTEHFTDDKVKSFHPAMVAKIVAPDGSGANVHRTYLTMEGRKAAVDPGRKVMFGGIVKGSAVRLFEDIGDTLGIAEGIETAYSASILFNVPVWSALNSALLQGWEPPQQARSIMIFADHDENCAGQIAAYNLAKRLRAGGLQATVELPPEIDTDWNDVLTKRIPA